MSVLEGHLDVHVGRGEVQHRLALRRHDLLDVQQCVDTVTSFVFATHTVEVAPVGCRPSRTAGHRRAFTSTMALIASVVWL
jgi:hypothetical protein